MDKNQIVPLGANTYYLKAGEAVVSFTGQLADDFDKGKLTKVQLPDGSATVDIMSWGKDNDLPQQREALVSDNNIVPALIERKRNIITGNGYFAYTKRLELQPDGKIKTFQDEVEVPPQAAEFFEANDLDKFLADAAGELMKHGMYIPEYIRNKGGQIIGMEVKECKYMRAARKNADGRITRWFWSGFWGRITSTNSLVKKEDRKTVEMPVYAGEDGRQPRFIQVHGDFLFNDGYYPIPSWWGGWEWIELSNCIPQFHKANLLNGYNIRWHVEIPADYFLDYVAYNDSSTAEAQAAVLTTAKEREQEFMDNVNQFLAGISNAGRTIFTKYELDKAVGKDYPGIKIKALDYDMKDKALLDLFDKSNTANISAQGIHPTLANIETQGRLSSGTEIRNAYLMWLIINTYQPRRKMLKPVELVKRVNGWPAEVFYGIRDFELTALSEDKSGIQTRQEVVAQ